MLGQDNQSLRDEVYTIEKIEKMEKGDYWQFNARLKFENYDFSAPIPLEVKWAGDTPVITLTDFTSPGLGTFDARVLFYNNKYAGTWTHGDHGGHLFGRIERQDVADDKKNDPPDQQHDQSSVDKSGTP